MCISIPGTVQSKIALINSPVMATLGFLLPTLSSISNPSFCNVSMNKSIQERFSSSMLFAAFVEASPCTYNLSEYWIDFRYFATSLEAFFTVLLGLSAHVSWNCQTLVPVVKSTCQYDTLIYGSTLLSTEI